MELISIEAAGAEMDAICKGMTVLEKNKLLDHIQPYFDLIEKKDHQQFADHVLRKLEGQISKFTYPSDFVILKNELAKIVRLHGQMARTKKNSVIVFETVLKRRTPTPRPIPASDKKESTAAPPENETENETENDALIRLTVDEYMEDFNGNVLSKSDYVIACEQLTAFFKGQKVKINKPCSVQHGNKKKLAYVLSSLYRKISNDPISFEFLTHCTRIFGCYNEIQIDRNNRFKNSLYKYFTTKNQ